MPAAVEFVVVMNRIPELIASVEANSRSRPKAFADKVLSTARANCPVDTGALKGSGYSESLEGGKSAEVGFTEDYAGFVEYGTYKMSAQPYLGPAFAAHEGEFIHEMGVGMFGGF
jgi:HK97 gp10 family phage protein